MTEMSDEVSTKTCNPPPSSLDIRGRLPILIHSLLALPENHLIQAILIGYTVFELAARGYLADVADDLHHLELS